MGPHPRNCRHAKDQWPLAGRGGDPAGNGYRPWRKGRELMQVDVPWADHCGCPMPRGGRMSYESRKKKRQYKRINAKAKQRRTPESARRWFLTLAKSPGKCEGCGDRFERGGEIVFRYEPRSVR